MFLASPVAYSIAAYYAEVEERFTAEEPALRLRLGPDLSHKVNGCLATPRA